MEEILASHGDVRIDGFAISGERFTGAKSNCLQSGVQTVYVCVCVLNET